MSFIAAGWDIPVNEKVFWDSLQTEKIHEKLRDPQIIENKSFWYRMFLTACDKILKMIALIKWTWIFPIT